MDITRWARLIHIYTAAPVLVAMVMFSITGLLLNHSDWDIGETRQFEQSYDLPTSLTEAEWSDDVSRVTLKLLLWLEDEYNIRGVEIESEWEEDESLLVINLDGPSTAYTIEAFEDERSVQIYARQTPFLKTLSNIHSSDHVSSSWRLFSDIAAILMLLFTISGIWLVLTNINQRYGAISMALCGSSVFILIIYTMH